MHRACRSCHASPDGDDPAAPASDCGTCHGPGASPPSLRPLFPMETATLEVAFDRTVPERLREAWTASLRARLEPTGVRLAAPGTPGAPTVTVRVSAVVEEGATDAGTAFRAARARAVLTVHLARVEVESRPAVGDDAARCVERALEDLLPRAAMALSL